MKHVTIIFILVFFVTGCQLKTPEQDPEFQTFCNPIDLSYRFSMDKPSRREAADPSIVWFRDRYFLFASKSGGYWYSTDLTHWEFIETTEIPTEEYAPTAVVINDTLYFLASSTEKSTLYKSNDPVSGHWTVEREEMEIPVWDPAFFLDDDKRLYLYWGCSNENPLYGVEVDYENNFSFIGKPTELKHANPMQFGWEVPGDYNTLVNQNPWIEGAWMNKIKGIYYLQYSGPGTEYKSYSDGVYTSDNPLGPFKIQSHNPFAYKPEGFAAGAGHGSTFADQFGNYWHIGTMTISQKHIFERRLGLFPSFFDAQGSLYSSTKFGDYPMKIPQKKIAGFDEIFSGWMLLSFNKRVQTSSMIDSLPSANMNDENIRTYWAAETGNAGEYAIMDLGEAADIYAVQINFAEHNTDIFGIQKNLSHRYIIEYSDDGSNWSILIDKSNNKTDNSHDYTQLPTKVSAQYLKISNLEVPGGHFAISGFRVFGKGHGNKPGKVGQLKAKRNPDDRRSVYLSWEKPEGATGYNISYGVDSNHLHHNYMVYLDSSLVINSLATNHPYYFSIESFNENGITSSNLLINIE